MRFGYTIFYVDSVETTIAFYERAFGLKGNVVAPNEYGELDTGGTRLGFFARPGLAMLFAAPVQSSGPTHDAPPVEVAFVTDDVKAAFDKAVAAGAVVVAQPTKKPWGQTAAYLRDNNGFIVELCTPIE
jgi:catechol 2,3-dioxygenase-like lactoylglutathione lyase family enzyme